MCGCLQKQEPFTHTLKQAGVCSTWLDRLAQNSTADEREGGRERERLVNWDRKRAQGCANWFKSDTVNRHIQRRVSITSCPTEYTHWHSVSLSLSLNPLPTYPHTVSHSTNYSWPTETTAHTWSSASLSPCYILSNQCHIGPSLLSSRCSLCLSAVNVTERLCRHGTFRERQSRWCTAHTHSCKTLTLTHTLNSWVKG